MLYFLHGTDTDAVKKKAQSLVADLLKKKPDASVFTLTDENWNDDAIDEYVGGQGLFANKYIVVIKNILTGSGISKEKTAERKEFKERFLEKLEIFAESPNIFIMSEGFIDKVSLKKIEKHAEKVQEFLLAEKSEVGGKIRMTGKSDFNIFSLTDAFGSRDKKTLWVLYRQAVAAGKVPEEIHGILFWQLKSMVLAARTKSAEDAGLAPFVYSKSKRAASNFSSEELALMLGKMVGLYHDSHRGIHDFETALERFILEF